ncbi:hypothetical protein BRE01_60020 [Brevibacillus reuszeri]|uniref:Uncharacterized protein n=1 Tax=Brevibacillus reuszeri TaxID=54915 RepID=A0ABQ0TWQ8_9BACL|nr:hypothetical protein BRE01_60020 [Brevibacillus reuszeri]
MQGRGEVDTFVDGALMKAIGHLARGEVVFLTHFAMIVEYYRSLTVQ